MDLLRKDIHISCSSSFIYLVFLCLVLEMRLLAVAVFTPTKLVELLYQFLMVEAKHHLRAAFAATTSRTLVAALVVSARLPPFSLLLSSHEKSFRSPLGTF